MSLNGLDSPEVQEAYNVAIAEAGGWFLLKYTSRDSVDLLGRGKGGVLQARHALATYNETSPLYGLIIYRRRKVLIKYIPEGTSRVLKARTAVHFQDVLEKYAPYETLVEITSPEGLNDTSLAAAFPLHTATPSASSSRLDEISEDAEDGGASVQTPTSQNTSMSSYFETQRNGTDRQSTRSPPPISQARKGASPTVSPVSSPLSSPKKASVSQFLVRDDSGQRSITSLVSPSLVSSTPNKSSEEATRDTQSTRSSAETAKPTTPTSPRLKQGPIVPAEQPAPPALPEKSNDRLSKTTEVRPPKGFPERPITVERAFTTPPVSEVSSFSERPKYEDDPYDFSRFDIKPKVKLGPRPVAPGEKAKRPTVASISSVPATYRPTTKKQEQQPRPKSQGPISAAMFAAGMRGVPLPPPIPDMPEYNPRPVSRGSVKSLPSHKSTAMTPDKIRLMKAVELRKKQLRKSNPQADTFVPPPDEQVPAVPKMPGQPANSVTDKMTERSNQPEITPQVARQSHSNKDSGISMEYDRADDRDDGETPDVLQAEETRQSPTAPSQPALKDFESSGPRSPRVDTLRVGQSQAFREPEPDSRAAQGVFNHGDLADLLMPLDSIQPASSIPRQNIDTLGEKTASLGSGGNVPKIIMADGSRPISATVKQARTEESSPVEPEKSADESEDGGGDLDTPEKNVRRQNSDIAKRRRGFVEPLHIEGDEFTSDDDFMDELQSATVHQAKPITVARSPVAHYFPRRPSNHSAVSDLSVNSVRADRASAMPLDFTDSQERLTPDPTSYSPGHTRSVSTPLLDSYEPTGMTKRNVSGGIPKRIQALAERSSLESSVYSTPVGRPLTPETSPSYFPPVDQRELKRSPPTTSSRTSSFRAMSRNSSRISSYQKQAAANAVPQAENNAVWNMQRDGTTNVNSVSVTARIVRPNPVQPAESPAETEIETEPELQPSQLVINHRRGTPSQTNAPQLPRIDTNPKPEPSISEPSTSRATSPSMTRSPIDGPRAMHSQSKFGRHKATPSQAALSPIGPTADDFPPPPTSRYQTPNAAQMNDENSAPRESTRTSRFFKRMSNITGPKRRSIGLQSGASSSSPASERGSLIANNASLPGSKDKPETPPCLVVGDLNIQFPDSLLWKRRIVEIDADGYIIFSIAQATEIQRGAAKKYQLQEFKMPYVPDLDRQELPNSIMLDFVDGTTLQVACEDTMTHRQVVHVLKSYWRAWVAALT